MNGEVITIATPVIQGVPITVLKWEHIWFLNDNEVSPRDFNRILDYTGYFGFRLLSTSALWDIKKW